MLDAVFQLPVQERHPTTHPAPIHHRVIQEDLIVSVLLEKVQYLKGHLHILHPHPHQVSHTAVVDLLR